MREINKIAEGLFEKIRDRFEDVSLGDDKANATREPEQARFFNFDYVVDGRNHGNVTLSIIDENSLKVYFSKNITHDLSDHERKHWYDFMRELREYAKRNLLSFEPRDITRSSLKYRDIAQVARSDDTYDKDEVVKESRMYGTTKSSYEQHGPVRIIIRHQDRVDPDRVGDRSRHIRSIYLETEQGERFKLPHNNLRYARAMSRHLREGGSLLDEFGQHITEIAADCAKLKPFKTAMIRRVFEDEETQRMVEAAFEYHGLLKNTLNRMVGRKGYQQCKEQFVATSTSYIPEEDVDLDSLKERFVKRTYNERIQDALPLVHKAYRMMKENKFAQQFESWADRLAEGTWAVPESDKDVDELFTLLSKPLPVGEDAENATSALYNLVGDDRLYDELDQLAKVSPEEDARTVVLAWLQTNLPKVYDQLEQKNAEADAQPQAQAPANPAPVAESDKPVANMSRSELLDYCGVDSDKAHMYSNEKLQAMAAAKADEMTEGTYGSYGDVYENNEMEDPVWSAIRNRIEFKHHDLIEEYGIEAVMAAIDDVADTVGDVDEIGSSDVSGWVRRVIDTLGRSKPEEGGFGLGDLNENYDDYEDDEDDEEDNDEGFFVVISNEDNGVFIGYVTKEDGRWQERQVSGKPPYAWGGPKYMSYLKPRDVMTWIHRDYERRYEVKGPFADEESAREYAGQFLEEGGLNMKDLKEKYGARAPNDSSSPLTHANERDCDENLEESLKSEWDEYLQEGKFKELDIEHQDYKKMSHQQFQAAYGMSKSEWWAKNGHWFEKQHNEDAESDVAQAQAAQSKIEKPAYMRKQQGGDWKTSLQDVEAAQDVHRKEFELRKQQSGLGEDISAIKRLAGLK